MIPALSGSRKRYDARLKFPGIASELSASCLRNRCQMTGRPRGVFSKFGLCRHKIRELASCWRNSGIVKASW